MYMSVLHNNYQLCWYCWPQTWIGPD